ncbi:MAG: hypothetical protein SAJ37_21935 [Oscillatoria sp. PMC 1068.18]|nr:hypothetical protein [Oscillatoria sp. PMC 1076.18]MEC4991404.1 hypothetical protein [Oscillatoria sp. PMC 1068.18]
MSEIMTFAEMQHRYDNEWLLIAPKEVNEELQVIKGEVLVHSPNRDEVYKALETLEEQPLAIEYMGQIPQDLGFIL